MSAKKKAKKSFFNKWRKKRTVPDGLSTIFFELKLNSPPQPQAIASQSLQAPVAEMQKESTSGHPISPY